MWQNFIAKNFRCFPSVLLNPLERLNLIAGMNNTGKTSLLEAMHIHSYPQDCSLALQIHDQRGLKTESRYAEDVAKWLFFDQEAAHGFELISQDRAGKTRNLRMHLVDGTTLHAQFPEAERILQGSFRVRNLSSTHVVLKTEDQGKEYFAVGVIEDSGLSSVSNASPWERPSVFIGAADSDRTADVRAFSELEAAKQQDTLVQSLRILEPRLQRLSLLLLAGVPTIHGDVGLSRFVPLHFMGEGLRRLTSILLAIHSAGGGRVLIDEIENGLHHSVLKGAWQAIAHAVRAADVQVFATTHSWECLVKAHEAFAEDEVYDLRWHRLQTVRGEIQAITHDQEMIEAALYGGVEIR